MIKEYKTIQEIASPLMIVKNVEGVTYDELAEIELPNGEVRRCKVLEVENDHAVVQLFESAQGINLAQSKVRFLGHPLQLGVSEDMLGRVFNGMGEPIDGGVDFGNQLSLIVGQQDGPLYRLHKNFYELPPGWFRQLADQFLAFFLNHEEKELNLYYDRAGNNFEKQKEDYARKLKQAIEIDGDGNRTGWIVNLMSRKQSNIRQDEEYDFMQELMTGDNDALPTLLVDAVNCRETISSIEKAPAGIRYKGQQKIIYKVKKSEKLEPKKLPMLSTNFSDAFKYLMMRGAWRRAVRGKSGRSRSGPYMPGLDDLTGG